MFSRQTNDLLRWEGYPIAITRKKIKKIYLRVTLKEPYIRMSVPLSVGKREITSFLEEHSTWLSKHIREIENKQNLKRSLEGEYIFWGNTLGICPVDEADIRIDEDKKYLYLPRRISTRKWQSFEVEELQKEINNILPSIEAYLKESNIEIVIRKMESRWGSCQPYRRKITINRQLIHFPKICLEYILLHEMCHLKEANHQKGFYQWVAGYMPRWKEAEGLLKQLNGIVTE